MGSGSLLKWQERSITRTGVAADCATQHTVNLFTVTGDVVLIGIFGKVMFVKDAGAQLLRLGHVPTAGAEAFLCAASATTATDAADTIYTITGVVTDAMIVAPAALGVGVLGVNAAGLVGVPNGHVLVPGILRLTTSIANDITGLIDWTAIYRPMSITSAMTVL
ncbi:MAG: hypothetical protein U1B77_02450 [Dehalococcoidales bacterium]|nr:hypothetical protein [Dehalococcoidales bacterium]